MEQACNPITAGGSELKASLAYMESCHEEKENHSANNKERKGKEKERESEKKKEERKEGRNEGRQAGKRGPGKRQEVLRSQGRGCWMELKFENDLPVLLTKQEAEAVRHTKWSWTNSWIPSHGCCL